MLLEFREFMGYHLGRIAGVRFKPEPAVLSNWGEAVQSPQQS